jgi:hypothetical protein
VWAGVVGSRIGGGWPWGGRGRGVELALRVSVVFGGSWRWVI